MSLGTLTYFQKSRDNSTPIKVEVTLVSNNSPVPIVYRDQITPDPDRAGWTQIDVPLDARDHNWTLQSNGNIIPPYSMLCRLAEIKQLFIAANFDKAQRAQLDEVKLVGGKPKPEKPKADPKKLDFGEVSIIRQKVEEISIENVGKGLLHLRLLTPKAGPFTVDRSIFETHCMETLVPGDDGDYLITFAPRDVGRYSEKIFFEIGPPGDTKKVFLKVSGEGFVPK